MFHLACSLLLEHAMLIQSIQAIFLITATLLSLFHLSQNSFGLIQNHQAHYFALRQHTLQQDFAKAYQSHLNIYKNKSHTIKNQKINTSSQSAPLQELQLQTSIRLKNKPFLLKNQRNDIANIQYNILQRNN